MASFLAAIPARYAVVAVVTIGAAAISYNVKGTVSRVTEVFTDEQSSLSGDRGALLIGAVASLVIFLLYKKG